MFSTSLSRSLQSIPSSAFKSWAGSLFGLLLALSLSGTSLSDQKHFTAADREIERQARIEKAFDEGKIGRHQKELMLLMRENYVDPAARQQAIRDWMNVNEAALRAERDQERARLKPQRDAQRLAVRATRAAEIAEAKRAGSIGTKQAELMELCNQDFESPLERNATLRAWQEENGQALKAECETREVELEPLRTIQAARSMAFRSESIRNALSEGRIGRLQAEYMTLRNVEYDDAEEQSTALRVWLKANVDVFLSEEQY